MAPSLPTLQCAFRPKKPKLTNPPNVYTVSANPSTGYRVAGMGVTTKALADWEIFVPADEDFFRTEAPDTKYGMWCGIKPLGGMVDSTDERFIIDSPGEELPRWVKLPEYEIGMEIIEIKGEHAGRRNILERPVIRTIAAWHMESRASVKESYFARYWPSHLAFEEILGVKYRFPIGTMIEYPDSGLILHPGIVVDYRDGRVKVMNLNTQETGYVRPVELKPYVERAPMKRGSIPPAVKPVGRAPRPGLPPGALPPKATPSGD